MPSEIIQTNHDSLFVDITLDENGENLFAISLDAVSALQLLNFPVI